MKNKMHIGGQALIEGVMMKSDNYVASAIKNPKGRIEIIKKPFTTLSKRSKILGLPVLRGIVNLIEILWLGITMLNISASIQTEDEKKSLKKEHNFELVLTLIVSLFLALALFKLLPLFLTSMIFTDKTASNTVWFNLVDGLIRITIFLGYILVIAQFKDVKRVFQYHGAEHMAVHTYEAGLALVPKNARKFQTMHPRCGTSFLVFVLVTSILIFSIVPIDLPFFWLLLYRMLLILPIAGLSYELLKLGARIEHTMFARILNYPGILIQKITTSVPDDDQIKVAIKALKVVLENTKPSKS